MDLPPNKTKIVATIGPASQSQEVMEAMLRAGMNVARLNFSHGNFSGHQQVIQTLRAASAATGRRLAIMADLPGPKMRVGNFVADKVELDSGQRFTLTTDDVIGDQHRASVSFSRLPLAVKPGDALFLNDGYIQLEVVEVRGANVDCVVRVGGELRSRKGLNLPGIDLGISAFTEHDHGCLAFALENGVDAVSQSFVESAADIAAVRQAARARGHAPFIIAKIERSRALDRLDEILVAADGVMIARGDLGVEVPIEQIAVIQKHIMRRANQFAKPVITATQMLESMTTHRLPTRAEATDVANAILDGTDCVMLSGESATGAHPVEAVTMLAKIAAVVEPTRHRVRVDEIFAGIDLRTVVRTEHLVSLSVETCLQYIEPAAVFVPTVSGNGARRMAMLHLPVWTIAVSPLAETCQQLQFSYGVAPVFEPRNPESWSGYIREWHRRQGVSGKLAMLTAGPSAEHPEGNHRLEIIEL
ncbi:MAG TPA: pyruvate kinase [Candidatus Binatia bacterium]|nr:pyruvate kinase [Candidatus Binatia bacterium]